jgi:hypothetical protein
MSLVQITTSEKRNQASVETLLLNTNRILDFYASSATETVFWYKELEDRREKSIPYKTTLTKAAFETLIAESLAEDRIDIPVTQIYSPSKRAWDVTLNVASSDVVKGKDINTTESFLEVARGAFQKIKLRVSATISEIESASSTSTSVA